MTDSEIIKALRCCADRYCKGCSEQGKANCKESIAALSWDLINRQKAEIEKLKKDKYRLNKALNQSEDYRIIAKSEARREFAESLKEREIEVDVSFGYGREHYTGAVPTVEIDRLLKEMESNSL